MISNSHKKVLDILPPPKKQITTFRSMNLLPVVLNGIKKMKYRHPTSIQKKMIPAVLSGRDTFAMSRTGSGKTAGFLIPMLNRLSQHSKTVGIRAMVVSPARELAMQTFDFCRKLGSSSNLRIAKLIGGDPLHENFSIIAQNPDIVIGTPGRIVHILKEAQMSLQSMQCIVFDEADRLFENGFEDQLRDILRRCPSSHDRKQVVLVSATLPRVLMGFMKATCQNPLVLRLDEAKVSQNLKMAFFMVRSMAKWSVLIWLLRQVISKDETTLIFAPTKHHAEFAKLLIERAFDDRPCALIYGAMFADLRKKNHSDFRRRRKNILIVTDVAARGIDIPFLNNVVQLNIPAQPKLFIHRVGRAARAGRVGTAYSILSAEEIGYFFHLKRFLGSSSREIKTSPSLSEMSKHNAIKDPLDHYIGGMSQNILDFENGRFQSLLKSNPDLMNQLGTVIKAHRKFSQTRPAPMSSMVRAGQSLVSRPGVHPLVIKDQIRRIKGGSNSNNNNNKNVLNELVSEAMMKKELHNVEVRQTVFEFGLNRGTANERMMHELRRKHSSLLRPNNEKEDEDEDDNDEIKEEEEEEEEEEQQKKPKKRKRKRRRRRRLLMNEKEEEKNIIEEFKDPEMFLSYRKKGDLLQQGGMGMSGLEIGGGGKGGGEGSSVFDILEDKKSMMNDNHNDSELLAKKELNSRSKGSTKLIWKKGKYKRIHIRKGERWDPIRKKGRKTSVNTDGKNYEKWRKRTGGRVQKVGEIERDQEIINYQDLMKPNSGFHHQKNIIPPPPEKTTTTTTKNNFDGEVISGNKLKKLRDQKKKKREHSKRSMMVRKSGKLKEEWHLQAMERKSKEIRGIQENYNKSGSSNRTGKKRSRRSAGITGRKGMGGPSSFRGRRKKRKR